MFKMNLLCVSIVNSEEINTLVSTIDTSRNEQTSEYLQSIAEQEIENVKTIFKLLWVHL